MTKALTVSNVRRLLEQVKPQIALALPKHATADRFMRVALTQIRKNPKLLECSQESLLGAIVQSAQLGLEPDLITGFAYLVPYGRECTLIPGYKGLMALARNAGIGRIAARAVCKNDDYTFKEGLNPVLEHTPNLGGERGPAIFYYATAHFREGGELAAYEFMTVSDIEAIRKKSKSGGSSFSPWQTNFDEMAKKTVIRRMLKTAPFSIEMQRRISQAIMLDEMNEAGKPVDLSDQVDLIGSGEEPKQVTGAELFKAEPAKDSDPYSEAS